MRIIKNFTQTPELCGVQTLERSIHVYRAVVFAAYDGRGTRLM